MCIAARAARRHLYRYAGGIMHGSALCPSRRGDAAPAVCVYPSAASDWGLLLRRSLTRSQRPILLLSHHGKRATDSSAPAFPTRAGPPCLFGETVARPLPALSAAATTAAAPNIASPRAAASPAAARRAAADPPAGPDAGGTAATVRKAGSTSGTVISCPDSALLAVPSAASAGAVKLQQRRLGFGYACLPITNGQNGECGFRNIHAYNVTTGAAGRAVTVRRKGKGRAGDTERDSAGWQRGGEDLGDSIRREGEVTGDEGALKAGTTKRRRNRLSPQNGVERISDGSDLKATEDARCSGEAGDDEAPSRTSVTEAVAEGGVSYSATTAEVRETARTGGAQCDREAGNESIAWYSGELEEDETESSQEEGRKIYNAELSVDLKLARYPSAARKLAQRDDATGAERIPANAGVVGTRVHEGKAVKTGGMDKERRNAGTGEAAEELPNGELQGTGLEAPGLALERVSVPECTASKVISIAGAVAARDAESVSRTFAAGAAAGSKLTTTAAAEASSPTSKEHVKGAREARVSSCGGALGRTQEEGYDAAPSEQRGVVDAAGYEESVPELAAEAARSAADAKNGRNVADAGRPKSSLDASLCVIAAKNTKKIVNVVNRVRKHDLLNSLVASGLDWEGRGVVLLRVREMKKLFYFSFFRVLPGERLALRVEHVKQRMGEKKCRATCVGTSKPSEDETATTCKHFDESCGGCSILHLRYSRQLQEKQQLLREALRQHFLPVQQLQQHLLQQVHESKSQENCPTQQQRRLPPHGQVESKTQQQNELQQDVSQHDDRNVQQQQQGEAEEEEEEGEEEEESEGDGRKEVTGRQELHIQLGSDRETEAALMTPIPSPSGLGFHNRSEYVFLLKNGPRLGHYHIDSPDVTDIACCPKATPAGTPEGTQRVLVCFICQQTRALPAALFEIAAAVARDSRCGAYIDGIVAVPMRSPGKPARADDEVVLFGGRHIVQTVAGTRLLITAQTSFPTHELLVTDLWKVVLQLAEPQPHHVVWDFFAGCGLFSLLLAANCKHVFAFDPREENVAELRANSELNHRTNATVYLADLSCRHTLRALAAVVPTLQTNSTWDFEEEAPAVGFQHQCNSGASTTSNTATSSNGLNTPTAQVEPADAGRCIFRRWGVPPTLADAAVIQKKEKQRQEVLARKALLLMKEQEEQQDAALQQDEEQNVSGEETGSLWDEQGGAWTEDSAEVRRDRDIAAGGTRSAVPAARKAGASRAPSGASKQSSNEARLEHEDGGNAEGSHRHTRAELGVFQKLPPPDILLLQPSRLGCDKALRGWLRRVAIPKILYLSRYPPSMLRDISPLAYLGYTLKCIQPLDMFPHTANLMCAAVLTHSQAK